MKAPAPKKPPGTIEPIDEAQLEDLEGEAKEMRARELQYEATKKAGVRDNGDGLTDAWLYDHGLRLNGSSLDGKYVLIQRTRPELSDWGTVSADQVPSYRQLFEFIVATLDDGSKATYKCTLYGRAHATIRIVYVRLDADPERRRMVLVRPPTTQTGSLPSSLGAATLGALPAGNTLEGGLARMLLERLDERDRSIADLIARFVPGAAPSAAPAPAAPAPAAPVPMVSAFKQAADNLKEAADTITTAQDVLRRTLPQPTPAEPAAAVAAEVVNAEPDIVRLELPMLGEVAVSPRTVEWGLEQWRKLQDGNNEALRQRTEYLERAVAAEASLARLGRAREAPAAGRPEPPPVASVGEAPAPDANGAGSLLGATTSEPSDRETDSASDAD